MQREISDLRARLAEVERERDRLDAIVAAYPNATTDLARWAKPTIAQIDKGALQAISPAEDEDADGGTPWPGQCIGALIDGFLDLASDVGKHDHHADMLVHNAIDELRKVAAELRARWADEQAAIKMLTDGGVALDVHNTSSMTAHAASINFQARTLLAERDAALAALDAQKAELLRMVQTCHEADVSRDAAIADAARLREALEKARDVMTGMIGQEWVDAWDAADAALAAPHPGAGCVVLLREQADVILKALPPEGTDWVTDQMRGWLRAKGVG